MSVHGQQNVASELPGILDVDGARVPDEVRARFGDYRKAVASVIPVSGMQREE